MDFARSMGELAEDEAYSREGVLMGFSDYKVVPLVLAWRWLARNLS